MRVHSSLDANLTEKQSFFAGAGWIRSARYSPNGLLIACGMGGETTGMSGETCSDGSKRHSPREEDGTIKIVSGKSSKN